MTSGLSRAELAALCCVEGVVGPARVLRRRGEVTDQFVTVEKCVDATIIIADRLDSAQVNDCRGCTVLIAAITGSIKLDSCEDCTVYCVARQIRTRDCRNVRFSVACDTMPGIETSSRLDFSPLRYFFRDAAAVAAAETFASIRDDSLDRWCSIHDFNKDDASVPAPHFTINGAHPSLRRFSLTISQPLRQSPSCCLTQTPPCAPPRRL